MARAGKGIHGLGPRLGLALLAAALALVVMIAGAGPATAHPLGNFTLNRYARVEVSAGLIRLYYVIDLAEIPSYQVRKEVEADPDGYLDREVMAVVGGIELEVDGRVVELRAVRQQLSRPRGEGGMRRVRIDAVVEASLPRTGPDEVLEARFVDGNQPERIGWREMVVVAAGDATLVESSAPTTDVTDELRDYPKALLQDPMDLRAATFRFKPGSQPTPAAGVGGIAGTGRRGDRFTQLLGRQDFTPFGVAGVLGVAALVGAGHALAPGHGKTVMAAYLVGTKGRPVDALLLGLIVSGMHTTSVLVLGVGLLQVDRSFALDRLYPALTVASGVGVLVVGGTLATARLRALRSEGRRTRGRGARHDHGHGSHGDHGVEGVPVPARAGAGASDTAAESLHTQHASRDPHGHGHWHRRHSHALPADVTPFSRRGFALLGTAGGIVPSPSAVIVLVGSFSAGRIGLGLGLVLAFSIGLAVTLTAVGLTCVLGGRALGDHSSARLTLVFPVLGAMALLPLGLVLVLQGVRGLAG